MNARCFMVMVLFASTAVAVPVPVLNQAKPTQSPPQSQAPQNPRQVLSLHQLPHPLTPTSPILIPVLSVKKATTPIAHKKVEDFAAKLRADMELQERVLNVYIKTIREKHSNAETNLKRVKSILKGLKDEIMNATKYANQYQVQDNDLSKQERVYKVEYDKSQKMYLDEAANIKFEKAFLDEIIKYIQLRNSTKIKC